MDDLTKGILIGAVVLSVGVWLGYEIGRCSRIIKPLFSLPKFARKKEAPSKGKQYGL